MLGFGEFKVLVANYGWGASVLRLWGHLFQVGVEVVHTVLGFREEWTCAMEIGPFFKNVHISTAQKGLRRVRSS